MLITALDISRDKRLEVFAIVSIEEKNYSKFREKAKQLKHFREISSKQKRKYLLIFERRFEYIKLLLHSSSFFFSGKDALMKLDELATNSKVLIIDNKFYGKISSRYKVPSIPESKAVKHYKEIILLADNLANYIRIKFSEIEDYRKRAEIIRKFWK